MRNERRFAGVAIPTWLLAASFPLAAVAAIPPPIIGPTVNIGEQGVASAEPLVPVPPVTPCVVQLFTADSPTGTFDDYSAHGFTYTPPAGCTGPWNKVVFKADYNVTAGRQFDRTASVWIGGVNIYFGTTQEPRSTVSPSWHVERDVTDLSNALTSAQPGNAVLYNIFNDTYNGSITGSAELDFYPATPDYPAAAVPDQVLSLSSDPAGNTFSINTDGAPFSRTFTLPANIERAYLDVIAEAQSGDEFWYTCGPDSISDLTGCGGSGFREAQISIDGQPAGFAPISPWIYTGGIDPYLWRPIPGVQTLDFKPFRVDLTPFAAMLDNGQPHTVAVSVVTGDPDFVNNSQRFDTAATLLLYQDAGSVQVTGGFLGAPHDSGVHPVNTLTSSNGGQNYDINVTSVHTFNARGYVNTSHGRVTSLASESAAFGNHDLLTNSATFEQNINLVSSVVSTSTRIDRNGTSNRSRNWSFPLRLDYKFISNPDGSFTQATTVDQLHHDHHAAHAAGALPYSDSLDYHDQAADTLLFDSNFNVTGHNGQRASQSYLYRNSIGQCYSRSIAAADGAVTTVNDGAGCP
ncbi:MAG TPA: peptide-N4-asparagine amidase [Rhodanobacteraceae bacterium]|nr:peptide-N4-asparagine amidase [Rhodanobacteraceae bacterium]